MKSEVKKMTNKPYDLEERLIDFAVVVIDIVEVMPKSKAGNHIANQLVRSGTSPAPNYGEARGAESKKDFVHKLRIALKELRETLIRLKISAKKNFCDSSRIEPAINECEELIAIFVASTKTAEANK
jgi:four helix bundle protein